jgi:hypothetical protein
VFTMRCFIYETSFYNKIYGFTVLSSIENDAISTDEMTRVFPAKSLKIPESLSTLYEDHQLNTILCIKLSVFMTNRQRFIHTMEYKPVDNVPNHEVGVWQQTIDRWSGEGVDLYSMHWDWFTGEEFFGMDAREFIAVNYGMMPPFERTVIESTERYEIFQDSNGIIRKALIEGTVRGQRISMDQYLKFPVEQPEDFHALKKRYISKLPARYPAQWESLYLKRWKDRDHVLVLGKNVAAAGFYWRAREWMGTENLSFAWYDYPNLMHEMMEFYADFTIEVSRPILEKVDVEYFNLSEDLSMKNGPLLSPDTFRTFIKPHMKRLVSFMKSNGVRYVTLDTDGNPDTLIPDFLDVGIDLLWPLERAAGMDPVYLRKKYGKSLRLAGGVDKRVLATDKQAIHKHLELLRPVIEEGGYIPQVDHLVPPDVSYDNFCYYMDKKRSLLEGR